MGVSARWRIPNTESKIRKPSLRCQPVARQLPLLRSPPGAFVPLVILSEPSDSRRRIIHEVEEPAPSEAEGTPTPSTGLLALPRVTPCTPWLKVFSSSFCNLQSAML